MRSRFWLILLFVLFLGLASGGQAAQPPLRIGTTAVFLDDQVDFLSAWQAYLEQRLGRQVIFVRRGNYGEINDLLQRDQLEFAWTCGYPYVRYKSRLRLLAVPVFNGQPLYQSYLIVPRADTRTRGYGDLQGKVFAYSDPNSNSGWLVPQYEMYVRGIDSTAYFRKFFFTWAHRKVVEAVAAGLADAGAVDGYVWETLALQHPELTSRTRVVYKSAWYGFPPFVARRSVARTDFEQLQQVLLNMNQDDQGRALLKRLNLDGFIAGSDAIFAGIAANMRRLGAQ
jgi:phosphonate transport system substrate-binding protein